jgi:hypothetical protein
LKRTGLNLSSKKLSLPVEQWVPDHKQDPEKLPECGPGQGRQVGGGEGEEQRILRDRKTEEA